MAELKILFLFLIIFNDKKEFRCNALDIAPQGPEISTKLSYSDNELTHVRTKNLSGNVKLTTLELLTTNTPFDDLNNASQVIFEGTTSENKHSEIEPIVENGQEDALLLSSEIGTKAPTDGFEPFALMDVFNSTSGTFPDQNSTEKLITVTPLNKLIDEDFDITEPNKAHTETLDFVDKATRDFEENEEMPSATQNYSDIEDLATFMKLDEEFLNTVTDKSEELEFLNEAIEEISSILSSYEDKSHLSPSLEEDNSETKKQADLETTTKALLTEERENNEENANYETTTNLQATTTTEENLIEKSTISNNENESQFTINVEEENKIKKSRHFEISSTTKEYLTEDVGNLPVIFHTDDDKMNYKTTTTIEDLNEEYEVNSQTISTVTTTEKYQFIINAEEDKSEKKKEINFETTTTYEDNSISSLSVEEENNEGYEDEMSYKATTTVKFLKEEYEENSGITTTTSVNIEEGNNEINFETTTTYEVESMPNLSVEEENNEEYEDEMNYETTKTIKGLNEDHEDNSQTITTTVMNNEEENNEEYEEKITSDISTITNEDLIEEYEIKTLVSYETTTTKQIFEQQTTVNDSEVEEENTEENTKKHTDNNLANFETNTKKEEINEITENISSFEDKLNSNASVNEEINLGTQSTEETTAEYVISGRFAEEQEDLNSTTEEEEDSHSDNFSHVTEDFKINERKEATTEEDSTLSTRKIERTTTSTILSTADVQVDSTKNSNIYDKEDNEQEEREYLNNTTEENETHSDNFSDVTEEFKIKENNKEDTTENDDMSSKDCEEDSTIYTTKLERTTTSTFFNTENIQVGTTENSDIYEKAHKQEERDNFNNTGKEEETHSDNFSGVTEDLAISTRKIERTTTSTILNTEDVQVGTTEKSDGYEKIGNEQETEDKLTINIDINELEKIEEAIAQEINEIEEEDLKEINNEGTSFTESTPNYESKEIYTSTTILSFSKPDGYNQVITTAEMLKTESEKVEEPQISASISGRKQHFSVKIVYNESAFFVPSDALLTVQPPNFLNITWKAPNGKMNNSIELNFGNSLRLNLVKDNQMHVHKTALISEPEDKLSDTNLITLEEGIQIYFSNISFLKADENNDPGTLRRNNPMRTLAGEIVGSCIGACILIGIVVYFLAKKYRSKTRNFKPNGDA